MVTNYCFYSFVFSSNVSVEEVHFDNLVVGQETGSLFKKARILGTGKGNSMQRLEAYIYNSMMEMAEAKQQKMDAIIFAAALDLIDGEGSKISSTDNRVRVDYIFDGTSILSTPIENELDENRIVIYHTRRNKKGQIKDVVSLEKKSLNNRSENTDHSYYLFNNFGDGAISVWEFFARNSSNEWCLTEFKLNGVVRSRITSTANPWSVSGIRGQEFNRDYIVGLTYWVSVHSHPRGGNGLSSAVNPGDPDDMGSYGDILKIFPGAKMNAYDYGHLFDARGFIEINRK